MTKISGIIKNSVVDGPGLRTAIFFSGCRRGCKGCHNPEAQDFNYGYDANIALMKFIDSACKGPDRFAGFVKESGDVGITITGGHALEPENYEYAFQLVRWAKRMNLNVWLYTGYVFEQIPIMYMDLISWCDVVVDGPFIESLKSDECLYRGSTNQRLIDVEKTFDRGEIVLWDK